MSNWICYDKKKNERITPLNEIQNKFWFYLRSAGNYCIIVLWIMELQYFRVSTCQSFANSYPIVVLFLSSFVLHEPFYLRYDFWRIHKFNRYFNDSFQ